MPTLNLAPSLVSWIDFLWSNMVVGPRLLLSWHTKPNLIGNEILLNKLLRNKSLTNGWNRIPLSTSMRWHIIWHKHKAQKKTTFLWLVIHKAMAVNEWHGQILTKADKICPHCGLQCVELVEHKFLNCPFAQQVWHYATNIIWQLFAKSGNLGPWK